MKNKILFISYYFPPIQSVGCIRNYYFAKEFKSVFDKVDVITTDNSTIFPKQELPLSNLQIFPVSTFDYRRLYYLLSRKEKLHHNEESKNHPFLRFFLKLNETLPFSIFLGEGGLIYIWNAYKKAIELITNNNTTHCFSSYRVAGDIIIASLLKRKFSNLIWIADFHDLPYDEFRKNAFFPKLQTWFWKKILKNADKVITVSNGLATTLRKWHPNVQVVRNGILNRDIISKVDNEQFIINYTGSLYQNAQNADVLWQVLKALIDKNEIDKSKFRIRYAGKDSSLFRSWLKKFELEEFLEDRGMVSREEAMKMQETAAVNLLLTWSFGASKGIVTGKIYEYLSARRPILLLINGEQDLEMEDWFEEMQCGEVFYNHLNSNELIKNSIIRYYKLWLNNEIAKLMMPNNILNKMTWANQVESIFNKI